MTGIVYQDDSFRIIKTNRDYVLRNRKGRYKNHGHFKKLTTCYLLIGLMNRQQVPDNKYLRESVLRISTDSDYIERVNNKIDKERDKTHYINVNKGVK